MAIPGLPDPSTITETELKAWWSGEAAMMADTGIDPAASAEAMIFVGAELAAALMGPRQLARILYGLALRLTQDADRIDLATAEAMGAKRPN